MHVFGDFARTTFEGRSGVDVLRPLFGFGCRQVKLASAFFLALFDYRSNLANVELCLMRPASMIGHLYSRHPIFFRNVRMLPSTVYPATSRDSSFRLLGLFMDYVTVTLRGTAMTFRRFANCRAQATTAIVVRRSIPHSTVTCTPLVPLFHLVFLVIRREGSALIRLRVVAKRCLLFRRIMRRLTFLRHRFVPSTRNEFTCTGS